MQTFPFQTALVIEARPLVRRALQQALLRAGVQRVLEADGAQDALQLLSAELVQLVLTPWAVPGLEGRALIQALRRRGRNQNVAVVLLDDGLSQAQIIVAVKAGMAGRLAPAGNAETVAQLLRRIAEEAGASGASAPTEDAPRAHGKP